MLFNFPHLIKVILNIFTQTFKKKTISNIIFDMITVSLKSEMEVLCKEVY